MESEKTIRFFLLKPGGRLTGNHCVATVYALYIFYQYVCICSIFHKNHCFVSACCTENRLVGWKGGNGESCWGQGQLLRQEGTDVGSRAGIWWRQKKLLPGTFNLCFSNWVQGLIPETVLECVMEKMSERGFYSLIYSIPWFLQICTSRPRDEMRAIRAASKSPTPSPLPPSTQPYGRTRTLTRTHPTFSTTPPAGAECWQHAGPCRQ